MVSSKLFNFRRLIWEDNVRHIQKHNLEADRGEHTYTLGMNEYGDLVSDKNIFIWTFNSIFIWTLNSLNTDFYSSWIRTLVAMAAYASHIFVIGKMIIANFCCLFADI